VKRTFGGQPLTRSRVQRRGTGARRGRLRRIHLHIRRFWYVTSLSTLKLAHLSTVNAKIDDPEHVAVNGQILGPVEYNHAGKRKRVLSAVAQDDRAPKRQKTLDGVQPLPLARTSWAGAESETDSDYDTDTNSRQSTSREDQLELAINSDYYLKPSHDPELTIPELNSKYRRQKEIIKSIIAILSKPWFLGYL
jgi:hypothetical protein